MILSNYVSVTKQVITVYGEANSGLKSPQRICTWLQSKSLEAFYNVRTSRPQAEMFWDNSPTLTADQDQLHVKIQLDPSLCKQEQL